MNYEKICLKYGQHPVQCCTNTYIRESSSLRLPRPIFYCCYQKKKTGSRATQSPLAPSRTGTAPTKPSPQSATRSSATPTTTLTPPSSSTSPAAPAGATTRMGSRSTRSTCRRQPSPTCAAWNPTCRTSVPTRSRGCSCWACKDPSMRTSTWMQPSSTWTRRRPCWPRLVAIHSLHAFTRP